VFCCCLTTMSGDHVTREEFQSLYTQVQSLTETVEDLEQENRDLRDDLEDVRVAKEELDTVLQDLTTLETDLESLTRDVNSIQRRIRSLDENTDKIEDDLEGLEQEMHESRYAVEQKISDANRRITGIEAHLDIDEVDLGRAIHEDASELEHLSLLPDRVFESEVNSKPLRRAVEIYEHFDKWSEYTPKGYIIKSGDLKRYMSEELEWSQLYRAMEKFGNNTDERYTYIDHHKHGKALIRFHPDNR